MVKETKYRHHPVPIENGLYLGSQQLDILGFRLDLQDAVLTSAVDQDDTGIAAAELKIDDHVTVPTDAIAIVISIEVNDVGSAANECYMGFCPTGRIGAGRTQYVYCENQNDAKGSRILIVELSDYATYSSIGYMIVGSDGAFDYSINLIGWLIGGTRILRLVIPTEDLLGKCTINHPP